MSESPRSAAPLRRAEPVLRRGSLRGLTWLAGAAALYVAHTFALAPVEAFRFDDSYITLRYAGNLVHHGVLSFNADDRVNGFTSPLWTLLLAGVIRLGADPERAMLVGSHLAGFASVLAAALCARALGASRVSAFLVASVGLLLSAGFVVWTAPGMETPLVGLVYVLLLAGGLVRVPSSRDAIRRRFVAVLVVLAALVRPEGALLAAGVACVELASAVRPAQRRESIVAARPMMVACAIVLGAFALQWAYYGYPLPNTFYAKSSTPTLLRRGFHDALDFLRTGPHSLAPVIALAFAARPGEARRRAYAVLFVLWYVVVLVVYARSGGDYVGFHRFYQPLLPVSLAFLAWAVSMIAPRRDLLPSLAIAALIGTAGIDTLSRAFPEDLGNVSSQTRSVDDYRLVGAAIGRTLRPHDVLAVRTVGMVPFAARAPHVLDTLALNNPAIAHHNAVTNEVPGHQKEATREQLARWRPSLLVAHPVIEPTDQSGVVPGWMQGSHWERYGYRYRCLPMADGRFTCFFRIE